MRARTRGWGSGPGEGSWELRTITAPPSAVPRPRGQDVGHKMTKPRKKSSTGCSPVMKSPLCSAPSSLVTQGKVCWDHGHPTWVWRHYSTGLQHPNLSLCRMCREPIHRAKLRPEMQFGTGKVKGNRQRLEERVVQCSHRGRGHTSTVP